MLDKNKLKKQIKSFVGSTIYSRGLSYFNHDKIKSVDLANVGGKILVDGIVSGTKDYNCGFVFDLKNNQFKTFDCDCPYPYNCKHSTALALYFLDSYVNFAKQQPDFDYKKDVDDLADFVKYNRDEYTRSSKYFEKVIKEQKERLKQEDKIEKKFNINDYYLSLSGFTSGYLDVDLNSEKYPDVIYSYYIEDLLRRYDKQLSKKQKTFFNLLSRGYYYKSGNIGKILELAKEVGVKVYKGRNVKTNPMVFVDNNKITAELNFVSGYNEFWDAEDNKLIFKVSDNYKKFIFINGDKNIIGVFGDKIFFYKLPKLLIDILDRVDLSDNQNNNHYYGYENLNRLEPCSTVLKEGEILKINSILKEAKKYLDFKTNIVGEFKFNEVKKPKPSVLVDYDSDKNTLKVLTVMDYGFEKIPVRDTVFYSNSQWGEKYKRRDFYRNWDRTVIKIEDGIIHHSSVFKKEEIKLFKKIYESDGYYGIGKRNQFSAKSKAKIYEFAEVYLPRIKELKYPIIFTKDVLEIISSDFKANFDVDMDVDNDWLYFDVDCYCGEDKISSEDLVKFVEGGENFIKMKDGRLLKITNKDELERFVYMLESFYARENNSGFKGKLYNAPELENIFTSSEHYSSRVASGFKKFMNEVRSGKPVKKVRLPKKIKDVLRDYQVEGIDWFYFLRKYRFAGILADDMGLGKTIQALILMQKEMIEEKPSIVVCPKTLLYNWQEEAEKFTPNMKTIVIDGMVSERKKMIKDVSKYDLVVTSYSTLKNDFDEYEKNGLKFNYLVIDEAQFIKNHKTKTAQVVKKVNADYRLALTGTPLENSVSEIWSIFEFLMPGFLGSNKNFVKKFQNPIMKNNSSKALEHLRKKTECFMLRRTKGEVLAELPPKIEQISHCRLGKEQNILYQEILKNVKKELFDTVDEKGFAKSQIHILAALTKLRQVCNHPVLLLKDKDYKKYESAKLKLFMELVREISESGRKVLVFSQFTKMLDILGKELDEENINYLYLSGKTKNRQELVKSFNEDNKHSVFLISLKAGGIGLNLTSADNVIIFDPWWNPSVENQAVDRAHRMGQKKSVNVYRLITQGTIEEKIVALQERKRFLFDSMVGETKDLFKKLTWNDVKNIFEENNV